MKGIGRYILNERGDPVRMDDLMTWALWLEEDKNRIVKQEWIGKRYFISTVFLGLDYSFSDTAPPILWETMVKDKGVWTWQDRCGGNREQAEAMHARMLRKVRKSWPKRVKR